MGARDEKSKTRFEQKISANVAAAARGCALAPLSLGGAADYVAAQESLLGPGRGPSRRKMASFCVDAGSAF